MGELRVSVLLLHGFLQNGKYMAIKTAQLRRLLKDADFVCPDAVFEITPDNHTISYCINGRAVYTTDDGHSVKEEGRRGKRFAWLSSMADTRKAIGVELLGVEESVAYVQQLLRQHRPKYIVGFSQSGTVLLYMLQKKIIDPAYVKVMLVSPYYPAALDGQKERQPIDVLWEGSQDELFWCIYGQADQIVGFNSWSSYKRLESKYPNCKYYKHDGGHYIPVGGGMKSVWRMFLAQSR